MKDLKRAFGSPDPEFKDRVRETLFRIEEKEEAVVKKKLTFSMVLALILCVCIVTVSALAGAELLTSKPDVTQPPLSQSENKNPNSKQPNPQETLLADWLPSLNSEVCWPEEEGNIFHITPDCEDMSFPCTIIDISGALDAGGEPCPICFSGENGEIIPINLSTPSPMPALTPVPTDSTDPIYVWSAEGDSSYHADRFCSELTGAPMRMTLRVALNRMQSACPFCFDEESGLSIATQVPRATAVPNASASATPTPMPTSMPVESSFVQPTAAPLSSVTRTPTEAVNEDPYAFFESNGMAYWAEEASSYFHSNSDCEGMSFPCAILDLSSVLDAGGEPCPICYGGEAIYTVVTGDSHYHHPYGCDVSDSGLQVTITEALLRGKLPCAECVLHRDFVSYEVEEIESTQPFSYYYDIFDNFYHSSVDCAQYEDEYPKKLPEDELIAQRKRACPWCMGYYLRYYSAEDPYYHETSSCEQHFGTARFHDAESALLDMGKLPCPICLPTTYYSSEDDPSFHADIQCYGDEKVFLSGSLMDMIRLDKTACKDCVDPDSLIEPQSTSHPVPDPELTYYWTDETPAFHTDVNCSGMKAPMSGPLTEAVALNKEPCPACLDDEWYAGDSSPFFHYASGCFGSHEAAKMDAAAVAQTDKTACPVCVKPLFYFYPHRTDVYPCFHTRLNCPEMTEEQAVPGTSMQIAIYQKEICPSCADGLFYCTVGGTFYHAAETCSGMNATLAEPITAEAASGLGKTACPVCTAG